MDSIIDFRGPYFALSNFSPYAARLDEEWYPTAEHAFQAAKTTNREDRRRIQLARTPKEAKRIGRSVQLAFGWEYYKDAYMHTVLASKFQLATPREVLLATGEAHLVEGNFWHDNYWGDCRCGKHLGGSGKNKLGALLMRIREEIQRGGTS